MDDDIKKVISSLPLGPDLKKRLLEQYDNLDPNVKLPISSILWDAYDTLYNLKFQENFERVIQEVRDGNGEITEETYVQVRKQTEDQIAHESETTVTESEIDLVRTKLQKLIGAN